MCQCFHHGITRSCLPTAINASAARFTCSVVCDADSCTRMRACPLGTTCSNIMINATQQLKGLYWATWAHVNNSGRCANEREESIPTSIPTLLLIPSVKRSFPANARGRMHALNGLACRARVTPASSHASPCSGETLTSPACNACGCAGPFAHTVVTEIYTGRISSPDLQGRRNQSHKCHASAFRPRIETLSARQTA